MVQFNPLLRLPTSEELPNSDDTPVDNESQNLIPSLLHGFCYCMLRNWETEAG